MKTATGDRRGDVATLGEMGAAAQSGRAKLCAEAKRNRGVALALSDHEARCWQVVAVAAEAVYDGASADVDTAAQCQ